MARHTGLDILARGDPVIEGISGVAVVVALTEWAG
jgi:hypothetical protein